MDKGSKVARESNESVGLLDILGSNNRWVFSKKKPEFLKTAKLSQFDVDCDWNS